MTANQLFDAADRVASTDRTGRAGHRVFPDDGDHEFQTIVITGDEHDYCVRTETAIKARCDLLNLQCRRNSSRM